MYVNKNSYIYIMASQRNGTIYIGVTSDLIKRVYEHKEGLIPGFTKQHDVKMLVYYEVFEDIEYAIKREKQLKNWHRGWKLSLIEGVNPEWKDLYNEIVTPTTSS